MTKIINEIYLPLVRAEPDLLNYPELRMYVQFPEEAERLDLNPEPYKRLVKDVKEKIKQVVPPKEPPKRKVLSKNFELEELIKEIYKTADNIREESAKDYVIAARLAFFALEEVRHTIEELDSKKRKELARIYNCCSDDPLSLRDGIVYDESIRSFEVDGEDFEYLGQDQAMIKIKNNIKLIFSHRSGETEESILADLAFGFQADFYKLA